MCVARYDHAIEAYRRAKSVGPRSHTMDAALGFTFHLKGDRASAILHYHQALGINPQDTLTSDLLSRALQEDAMAPVSGPNQ